MLFPIIFLPYSHLILLRLSLSFLIITIFFPFFSPLLLPFLHPSSHFPLVSDIRTWRGKRKQVILGLGVGSSATRGWEGEHHTCGVIPSPRKEGCARGVSLALSSCRYYTPVVGLFRVSLMKVHTAAHYGL